MPRHRTYSLNEQRFDGLDRESSYLLGLFTADGYNAVGKNNYICLTSYDLELLELARRILESNTSIKEHYVYFCSRYLCNRLASLGFLPNDRAFLSGDPALQLPHYIRGFFDGDGSISRPSKNLEVRICQAKNHRIIRTFYEALENEGLSPSLWHNGLTLTLGWCGQAANTFLKWMYQDSEGLRLSRKYLRWMNRDPKEQFNLHAADRRYWNRDWLYQEYITKNRTAQSIADECKCNCASVKRFAHKFRFIKSSSYTDSKLTDRDWLRVEFLEKRRRQVDIAQEIGCSSSHIQYYLRKFGLQLKSQV